jgi:hypothetical protein
VGSGSASCVFVRLWMMSATNDGQMACGEGASSAGQGPGVVDASAEILLLFTRNYSSFFVVFAVAVRAPPFPFESVFDIISLRDGLEMA